MDDGHQQSDVGIESNDAPRAWPPERRKLLIIHGVGDFDEETILPEVQYLAERYGIDRSNVTAFNWDVEVGGPFKGISMDLGILAELGAGLLNTANLGFLQTTTAYGRIPQLYLRFQNWVYAVGQIAFAFLIPLIVLAFVSNWAKLALVSIVVLLLGVSLGGALVSRSAAGIVVSFRRFVVTLLWPLIHFLAVPVGFGLIAFIMLILSLRVQNLIQFEIDTHAVNALLDSFTWFLLTVSLRIAAFGLTLIVMKLVLIVVQPVMKVVADVARYIGLTEHRNKLKRLLTKKFEEVASDCDSLIVLAHSLGSVIAVDCMLEGTSVLGSLQQIDFVTLGSPLRRLFCGLFPGIYSRVEAIDQALRKKFNRFTWTNVYRPLDLIGAHLSHSGATIVEFSTQQYLKNHTNYWRDPAVAALIVEGINTARRPSPEPPQNAPRNWPQHLCVDTYQSGISPLWSRRLQVFTGALLALITWNVGAFARDSVRAAQGLFSPTLIREMAREDGWLSTILLAGFVFLMSIGGLVVIIRFVYKKVWHEWIGAYGCSLLGYIHIAQHSPLMRYAPQVSAGTRNKKGGGILWKAIVSLTVVAILLLLLIYAYYHFRNYNPFP